MFEIVSYPVDLAAWDAESHEQPFYLELHGETRPFVALDFTQVLPAGSASRRPQVEETLPVYEYSWTIGHSNLPHIHDLLSHVQDPALHIFLYFPISRGWRVKELAATVKYLTPVAEQEKWLQRISRISQEVSPFIMDVSTLARLVLGTLSNEVATILSTIARLQINNVPRVEGFEWSVRKVTHKSEDGVMQGIQWTIPRQMFRELGNRLTGSIAVSFVPSLRQQSDHVCEEEQELDFQQGTLLARAEIHGMDKERPICVPPIQHHALNDFIGLQIAPRRES